MGFLSKLKEATEFQEDEEMYNYIILHGIIASELCRQVSEHREQGWRTCGGVSSSMTKLRVTEFYQAMERDDADI